MLFLRKPNHRQDSGAELRSVIRQLCFVHHHFSRTTFTETSHHLENVFDLLSLLWSFSWMFMCEDWHELIEAFFFYIRIFTICCQYSCSLKSYSFILQVWAESCSLEPFKHPSVQMQRFLSVSEVWQTKGTLSWFCFPEPAALICEGGRRKWDTACMIKSLLHRTLHKHLQNNHTVALTVGNTDSHYLFLISFSSKLIFIWHSKEKKL